MSGGDAADGAAGGHRLIVARRKPARGVHLVELRQEVEVARQGLAGAGRRCPQVAREQPDAVAQHAVVQQRGCAVQQDDVDVVRAERYHQIGDQLGLIAPLSSLCALHVDVDGHVDVTVAVVVAARSGAEQICLENLTARLQGAL